MPALGAAVLLGGEIVALGVVGVRRSGMEQAVSVDDLWQLASCTKVMTATLLAHLIERGDLRWDTKLEEALPDLAERMHPDYRHVTLRQLVDHRAGLPAEQSGGNVLEQLAPSPLPIRVQRGRAVEALLSIAPVGTPGRYVYSNNGFLVAGAVIERASDSSWEEAMEAGLFQPLGMRTAGFGTPGVGASSTQPWGHRTLNSRAAAIDPDTPFATISPRYGPAGSVHCSLEDWSRFVALHADGEQQAHELLSKASLLEMHRPVPGANYTCGLAVVETEGPAAIALGHDGSSPGWYACLRIFPRDRFAVMVVCNQGGPSASRACRSAAQTLAEQFRPLRKGPP